MKRPIKFRAWDIEKKQMVYDIQDIYAGKGVRKSIDGEYYEDYRGEDGYSDYGHIDCFADFLDSDNFIIMQYIGQNDEDETEIYEGDIVKICDDGRYFEIIWYEDTAQFRFSGANGLLLDFGNYYGSECSIVGNIFENPELLEVDE
jgi:uncharacterized phage protein (TIGR01671 family)